MSLTEAQKEILYAYLDSYTKYILTKDKNATAEMVSGMWNSIKSLGSNNKYLKAKDPIKLKSDDCDRYKQRIRDAKNAEDWIKIITAVSNDARDAREAGLTSVFAICLYALRSRIIHEIQLDQKSELCQQYNGHIASLLDKRKKLFASLKYAKTEDGNKPDPEDLKEHDSITTELAQLGHRYSIIKANAKLLLGILPTLNVFAAYSSLLTDATTLYTPVQPNYKRRLSDKDPMSVPLPVKLALPMEFQPNLYCWLPHYLSTGAYPKSDSYGSLTENYNDNTLLEKAGKYKSGSTEEKSDDTIIVQSESKPEVKTSEPLPIVVKTETPANAQPLLSSAAILKSISDTASETTTHLVDISKLTKSQLRRLAESTPVAQKSDPASTPKLFKLPTTDAPAKKPASTPLATPKPHQ